MEQLRKILRDYGRKKTRTMPIGVQSENFFNRAETQTRETPIIHAEVQTEGIPINREEIQTKDIPNNYMGIQIDINPSVVMIEVVSQTNLLMTIDKAI